MQIEFLTLLNPWNALEECKLYRDGKLGHDTVGEIHVVGWPCHPRQKGSENKPKTRKIQSCWAPQGRPRGLFGVYMDPTTHIWGQVYHSGAFHCWPESKLVKKSQKTENVHFGKNLDLAGDPKFCFFYPSRWFWGLKAHFQGWDPSPGFGRIFEHMFLDIYVQPKYVQMTFFELFWLLGHTFWQTYFWKGWVIVQVPSKSMSQ